MKRLLIFFLACLSSGLIAQTPLQITPGQLGAYGAAAGSIPVVAATPSLGHTHKTLAQFAVDLGSMVEVAVDPPLSGTGLLASPITLGQNGATSGQVLKWNGTAWAPAADNVGSVTGQNLTAGSTKVTITGGTGTVLSAASVDVNEANLSLNNIGGTLGAAKGGTGVTALANLTAASSKVTLTGGTGAVVVATSVDVNESNLNLANIGGSLPNNKIAQNAATTGQVLKWNGTAWAPAADAGLTAESQTISRNIATNNIATLSVTASTISVEDVYEIAALTYTAGQTTATTTLTLPAENNKIEVTRGGIVHVVGAAGCGSACGCSRTGTTFTFGAAISAGEQLFVKVPKQ